MKNDYCKGGFLYKEIPYAEIVKHWDNRYEWSEWQTCLYIATHISHSVKSYTAEEMILSFTNNWIIESAVKDYYGLDYYEDSHEVFHTGRGNAIPDFIHNGRTIELKEPAIRRVPLYKEQYWWGANERWYYNRQTNKLFAVQPDNSTIFKAKIPVKLLSI